MERITPKDKQYFTHLCELEPRLVTLFEDAKRDATYSESKFWILWYVGAGGKRENSYKARVNRLVGWGAGFEEIPDTLGIGEMPIPEPTNTRLHWTTLADMARKAKENCPIPNFPAELKTSQSYDLVYKIIFRALEKH